ncbi:conserved hypothetical protein [uncultured Eubacteriales bacterium]|uniref:PcfJ-like protein n=1 Tax=uncultured Eubacteriales bacterium TaxID=172733 RepID=A0A212IVF9_9FIRM|nr:conserved hypothetical protein [uncultured Eubacteriales bacterium]
MKKEKLRELRTLNATPKMMQMAAEDKPVKVVRYRGANPENSYKICIYMRCQQLGTVLKVAFFLPHLMRGGSRKAAYELFINRETGDFLTYDVQGERWSEAKLDMLQWPAYCSLSKTEKWINQEGHHSIKQYLGGAHGGYRGILEYQLSVREEQLKQRYKKETGPWDLAMEQIPPLPKDWSRWVDKVGITQHYMFYVYKRNGPKTGYCTWCETEVQLRNPRHNKSGRCPHCGHSITYKTVGRAGNFYTDPELVYLLQRCETGFVIRCFQVNHHYHKEDYRSPQKSCFETRRVIYNQNLYGDAYWYGDYKQHEVRWIHGGSSYGGSVDYVGRVYGKTMPGLAKKELARTGLPEIARELNKVDPEWWLENLRRKPWLEQIAKAGLSRLAYDAAGDYDWQKKYMREGHELHKQLKLDRRQLRRLRENNGGSRFLAWLAFEKKTARQVPDRVISWLERERIEPGELKFIRSRMSETQVCNYLQRQASETGENTKQLLRTWADYLSMAQRLKMDTSDAIIYRCKKLRQRHDELVERCASKEVALLAAEYAEKYPHVDDICKSLKVKYELMGDTYMVMAPTCIEEIINEGRSLIHCVGKSERYYERVETHEAYVLFLRKTEEPDKPYYTLEIEPGGTVRQKRTMFDRQNADIQDAEKFLRFWQKEVAKRLTADDMQMAEESRERRIQGYADIRTNGLRIQNGDLRGKLLADVLQADLMEAPQAVNIKTA